MTYQTRVYVAFSSMAALLLIVGFVQSWSLVLAILNLCLISWVIQRSKSSTFVQGS